MCGQIFGLPSEDIATAATMLLAIVGFMILYKISQPMNLLRICVWVGCLAGLLFSGIFLNQLFALSGMSEACVLLFVVFFLCYRIGVPVFEPFYRKIAEGIFEAAKKSLEEKSLCV